MLQETMVNVLICRNRYIHRNKFEPLIKTAVPHNGTNLSQPVHTSKQVRASDKNSRTTQWD